MKQQKPKVIWAHELTSAQLIWENIFHLFCITGYAVVYLFSFRLKYFLETLQYLSMMLTHDCKLVSKIRLPFKQRMKNHLAALIGFIFTLVIVYILKTMLISLFNWMLTLINVL